MQCNVVGLRKQVQARREVERVQVRESGYKLVHELGIFRASLTLVIQALSRAHGAPGHFHPHKTFTRLRGCSP